MASRNANGESYGKGRVRNFATVVYPESAPDDWKEILTQFHIPAFISPLHDKDTNPDGETKKAHFHVLLCWESPRTVDQAKAVIEKFGGVGCEGVNSLRGYARYLCHLDNPEKFQYDTEEVVSLCGADYHSAIGLPTDKYKVVRDMILWCKENQVDSYAELLEYSSECRPDWFRALCDSCTIVMKEYLKSVTWTENKRFKG